VGNRRLAAFVIGLFIALIIQGVLMYAVNPDYKSSGIDEGVGRGIDPDQFMRYAVRTENGDRLQMHVSVPDGYQIDVYLMTLDNLMKLSSNQSFEYIPSASQMNVSSYAVSIILDSSVEVYDFVIVGHASNPSGTNVHISTTQSHLPSEWQTFFSVGQFASLIVTTYLFLLIVSALYENSQEKNVTVKKRKKTRWNSIYMMSAYGTVAIFAIQLFGAMFLYWVVAG
jgi:hypothetical protein